MSHGVARCALLGVLALLAVAACADEEPQLQSRPLFFSAVNEYTLLPLASLQSTACFELAVAATPTGAGSLHAAVWTAGEARAHAARHGLTPPPLDDAAGFLTGAPTPPAAFAGNANALSERAPRGWGGTSREGACDVTASYAVCSGVFGGTGLAPAPAANASDAWVLALIYIDSKNTVNVTKAAAEVPLFVRVNISVCATDVKPADASTRSVVGVLSHFEEGPQCVARTGAVIRRVMGNATPILVYSKGTKTPEPRPSFITHYVKNEGREADTYLRYILEHYDKLPDVVIFTQACPEPFEDFATQLQHWHDGLSVLNLGGFESGTCDGTGAYPMHRLHELYVLTHNDSFCPTARFLSFMRGQFAVTRARILRNSRSFYAKIHALLHAPEDSFIHKDVLEVPGEQQRNDILKRELNNKCVTGWPPTYTLAQPPHGSQVAVLVVDGLLLTLAFARAHSANYFSYVMERAWVIIFDCMKQDTEPCS